MENTAQSATNHHSIQLKTEIPGPGSKALVARREQAVAAGLYKAHPIAVSHASGALVTDVDGNTFIDFVGGIGVLNVGHCPETVVNSIQEQAQKLLHFCALVGTYEPYVAVCERLNALVPISGPKKSILANSGAEGVENAIKLARAATGRPAVIAFEGGYHGRTLLTLTLTSKYAFKKTFGPFVPEIYRAPFPSAYRMGVSEEEATQTCIEALERMMVAQIGPEAVAAIIIEPVQGEGGFIPVPPAFMRYLRALCDKHGMLLIADEVQCGFGRTGKVFAMEHFDVEADLLVSAKSLAAGLPLAAVTGRAAVMDKAHVGGIGGTYGGNPLACVAALEVMSLLEEGALLERSRHIHAQVMNRGARWKSQLQQVGDVRGLGAMLAIELVKDRTSREPIPDETLKVIQYCLEHGVISMRAGLYANCIRLLMPLSITDAQLEEGLDVLEAGLKSILR